MRFNLFLSKASNLQGENRLLKFIMVCLVIAFFVEGLFMMYAMSYQRTIILPSQITDKIEVSKNEWNEAYIKQFAIDVINLLVNISPDTVTIYHDMLLSMVNPSDYARIKKQLTDMDANIKTLQISGAFYPSGTIKVNKKENFIEIAGVKRQYAKDVKVEDDPKAGYKIFYVINRGRMYVTDIKESKQR
jgi:type IV conjugative transfer system protein TraE